MAVEYEEGRANLQKLIEWYSSRSGDRNEDTTRLHLVDRLFFDCLGWDEGDCITEESHNGEYADYTFMAPRRVFVVEAKKEGNYFELPAGTKGLEISLRSLMRDHANVKAAVEQAVGYCQTRGIPLGAVSNGHQLIVFVATRNDGVPPLQGKALVFASLEKMLENFLDLWQAVSRPGVEEKRLQVRLVGDAIAALPPKLSATIPGYPGVKNRNEFQTNLQILGDLIIEDLARAREIERQFLEECYCRSGALSQYALTSKAILDARYSALFDSETTGPTLIPAVGKQGISAEVLAEGLSRRPILLIGDVGVGKTMFIRNLITIEAAETFRDAITLYIDFGSQAALTEDIRQFILNEITRQLRDDYNVDVEERNFVHGVYHGEVARFRKGIWADLLTTNEPLFRQKEVEFLAGKLDNQYQHLQASLRHIARGWKKQVVIFLDNTDQRSDLTQQNVFLAAQELAEGWDATVFVSLRPETFHRSARRGALTGYHAKAFTISPPRIDRVIARRLDFGIKLAAGDIPIEGLSGEISMKLENLTILMRIFRQSLDENHALSEFIDNVAAGNVRQALDFVKAFFGSGHVNSGEMIEVFERKGSYTVPLHHFFRAVLFGDNVHYHPERSPIANLLDISTNDGKEHFLLPLLIGALAVSGDPTVGGGFVATADLYERLQSQAFTADQIDAGIVRGHRSKLIETAARVIPQSGEEIPHSLRATTDGIYHKERLIRQFAYVDAMIVDTPITDPAVRGQISDVLDIGSRVKRAEHFIRYLDAQWRALEETGAATVFDWNAVSSELMTEIERIRERIQG